MGFIIDFFIKVAGVRKFFSIGLFAFALSILTAYLTFAISLGIAIGKAYNAFNQIFDYFFASSLGGTVGGNDLNVIIWSVLDALGILDVIESYVPIVFSTVVGYLSLYMLSILLSFQKNVYRTLVDAGVIFLG